MGKATERQNSNHNTNLANTASIKYPGHSSYPLQLFDGTNFLCFLYIFTAHGFYTDDSLQPEASFISAHYAAREDTRVGPGV